MKISRRKFIMTTTAFGVAGVSQNLVLAKEQSGKDPIQISVATTTDNLVQYFKKAGYVAMPAVPMISGHPFNGGLNYDDYIAVSSQSQYVVQTSSRIEDVVKKNQKGTLPLFTALGFMQSKGNMTEHAKFIFDCLISSLGLDPKQMSITSTELIKPLLPTISSYGIAGDQIQLRPLAEAKKAGDGSGWFAPGGHPKQVSYPTYSIEYRMPDGKRLEIAEMGISNLSGAFGIERITMAKNQAYISWNDYLPKFKDLVQADAQKNHKALPIGYYEILGLPKPA